MIKFRESRDIDDMNMYGVFLRIEGDFAKKYMCISFDHLQTARDHYDDIKEYVESYISKDVSEATLNHIFKVLHANINGMFDSLGNTSTCKFDTRILRTEKEGIRICGHKNLGEYDYKERFNRLYTIEIVLRKECK